MNDDRTAGRGAEAPDGTAAAPAPDAAGTDAAASGAPAPRAAGSGTAGPGTGPSGRRRAGSGPGRLAGWLVMGLVLVVALVVGVTADGGPRSPEERERDLAASVACPVCDGQSVADSDTPAARGVRSYIAERIAEGAGDDEILDELSDSSYGNLLLTPERTGVAGLVWLLPIVALVVAFAGLALAFRRWRGRAEARASAADRALVETALVGPGPAPPGGPTGDRSTPS